MAGDRSKTQKYRQLVALWLRAEHGIPVTPAPYASKPSSLLADDYESGHLRGLPDFLLNAHTGQMWPGEAVDEAKRDAAFGADPKPLSACIQFRKGRELADQLVFMNLETLAEIISRLEKAAT
jgi:hypothetical protein